ncbi:MAG: CDP-diacylglycerol--glycerol-3-phosphate 3-phosphatidyltransferase [Candidatus Sumerlaeia bacterium]|nr:CDP-diacylglycerol--glycerol-3-phosphate 3-phosphatidyltransferase [Candidatus Sumerlaeia bacterium]
MNLPNQLSSARIIAVPFFLLLIMGGGYYETQGAWGTAAILHGAALILTVAVTITDWLDGKIARDRNLITTLGKLLDPLADKIFVAAALIALSSLGLIPAWAVVVIISREFLITGLRSLATEQGRIIPADRLGKHKTGWQLALIITAIFLLTARATLTHLGHWPAPIATEYHGKTIFLAMIWIPLVVTLYFTIHSALSYVWGNRDLFTET